MAFYRVIGKPHRRMTMQSEWLPTSDGRSVEIKQNGPMHTFPVGTMLEDVTSDELEAFPDRFQAASEADVMYFRAQQAQEKQALAGTEVVPGNEAAPVEAVGQEPESRSGELEAQHLGPRHRRG